jgi:hypothetical protein
MGVVSSIQKIAAGNTALMKLDFMDLAFLAGDVRCCHKYVPTG